MGFIEVLGASLLLALSAQVAIPTPFLWVPFTLQTLAIFLISHYLGPKKAFFAVGCYLAEGALGMPVFAQGTGGVLALIGPRAGYFAGFLAAALLTGYLAEKMKGFFGSLAAFTIGNLAIYALGFSWLSFWMGPSQAFLVGVLPFLVGDVLKIFASAAIVQGVRKILC